MRVVRKEDITNPLKNPSGEEIYEMIGSNLEIGETTHHSFVHVVIPPGKSSDAHYHKVSEETYYILKGVGTMVFYDKEYRPADQADRRRVIVVGTMVFYGKEYRLQPGQACLIKPLEIHQIFNEGEDNLEFLTVSAPAWKSDDSFFITEEKPT